MSNTVVVITGAAPLEPGAIAAVPDDAVIIAADGGLDHALAAGLEPSVLVGDLDSISASGLAWASEHTTVVRHPVDKPATDTELAVAHAASLAPERIVLMAGVGDRLDHAVAALGALGAAAVVGVEHVEAWWGPDQFVVVRGPGSATLDFPIGTTFSVLATHGIAEGVTVRGARWPLLDHRLDPLVGLGVSNQVCEPPVTVSVSSGVVTIVIPGEVT